MHFINVGKINYLVNQTGDPSTNPLSDAQDCPSRPFRSITDIKGDEHFFEEDNGDIVNSESDLSLEETLISRIEIDTVIRLVREIKISKSSGMSISARLIRDALLALSHEFMHLLNKSLALGVFPDEWKMATVTPIPNRGISPKCQIIDLFYCSHFLAKLWKK